MSQPSLTDLALRYGIRVLPVVASLLIMAEFLIKKKPYAGLAGIPLFGVWFALGVGLVTVGLAFALRQALSKPGAPSDD
ncbi:MAG: hypothetical protein AAGI34_08100 [Pseudomonadota bacterium]